MAKHKADINVIALIGEEEESKRFKKDWKEGLEKIVVVVATSDQPTLVRLKEL